MVDEADEADELYGLPDAEFTSARDVLAKRLRGEKRRDEADAVKALRRPSVAAGAINRAVREHGADDLLAAGEALSDAHEALLSGDGDAAAVREATSREREAVRDFARLALGKGASASTEDKVRATLHAASVDDDVRELLVAGRLEREAEAGADPLAMLASKTRSRSSSAPKSKPTRSAPAKPAAPAPSRTAPKARNRTAPAARNPTAPAAASGRGSPRRNCAGRRRPSGRWRRPIAR
jgi:plasmid stability protein